MKNYQETLEYLYSFVDYSLVRNLRYTPEKFDLKRMQDFADKLENPQDNIKCIHVAGTKGKGSVCAMLANIFHEAGYKVGLYTSPHLQDFTERIQVNGKPITKKDFCTLIDSMLPIIKNTQKISTFEITTAAAFLYFFQQNVDIAVIEVGLGGRLDATNIVKPEISVITAISHDHTAILGRTLVKIAKEKGGIIKNCIPIVSASKNSNVKNTLEEIASKKNAKLFHVNDLIDIKLSDISIKRQTITLNINDALDYEDDASKNKKYIFNLSLVGPHQAENAATVLLTIKILNSAGWKVSDNAIANGFSNVKWPGRFEILSQKPNIIIDCAHNDDSMKKLIKTIHLTLKKGNINWLFGASEDKNIEGMFAILSKTTQRIYLTKSIHPRAASIEMLTGIANKWFKEVFAFETPEKALLYIKGKMDKEDSLICTGSVFIAAAVRSAALKKEHLYE